MGLLSNFIKARANEKVALSEFSYIFEELNATQNKNLRTLFLAAFATEYTPCRVSYHNLEKGDEYYILEAFINDLYYVLDLLEMVNGKNISYRQRVEFLGMVFGRFLSALSYGIVNNKFPTLDHHNSNTIKTYILRISQLLKSIEGFRKDILSKRIKNILKENKKSLHYEQRLLLEEAVLMIEE